MISLGFLRGVEQGALGWLVLMGALYIIGALMYAFRVPERFFPGRCNFWVCHLPEYGWILVVSYCLIIVLILVKPKNFRILPKNRTIEFHTIEAQGLSLCSNSIPLVVYMLEGWQK